MVCSLTRLYSTDSAAVSLPFSFKQVQLEESCVVAIVAYTHDLNTGQKADNL